MQIVRHLVTTLISVLISVLEIKKRKENYPPYASYDACLLCINKQISQCRVLNIKSAWSQQNRSMKWIQYICKLEDFMSNPDTVQILSVESSNIGVKNNQSYIIKVSAIKKIFYLYLYSKYFFLLFFILFFTGS